MKVFTIARPFVLAVALGVAAAPAPAFCGPAAADVRTVSVVGNGATAQEASQRATAAAGQISGGSYRVVSKTVVEISPGFWNCVMSIRFER